MTWLKPVPYQWVRAAIFIGLKAFNLTIDRDKLILNETIKIRPKLVEIFQKFHEIDSKSQSYKIINVKKS